MRNEYIEKIQPKTTTKKKLRFLRGPYAKESQYVKYGDMDETSKLLQSFGFVTSVKK